MVSKVVRVLVYIPVAWLLWSLRRPLLQGSLWTLFPHRRAPSLMTPDLTAKLYAWQRKGQSQGELELYAVLGVPETASDKDVRAAYRRMALRLHPDKAPCEATRAAHDQVRRKSHGHA